MITIEEVLTKVVNSEDITKAIFNLFDGDEDKVFHFVREAAIQESFVRAYNAAIKNDQPLSFVDDGLSSKELELQKDIFYNNLLTANGMLKKNINKILADFGTNNQTLGPRHPRSSFLQKGVQIEFDDEKICQKNIT